MRTLIVAFGHRARQGKSWLAEEIHCAIPRESKIYSFSEAVATYARVQGWMAERDPRVLQQVGELIRRSDPARWIKVLQLQIEEDSPAVALIPNLRFMNEFNWVHRHFGITVRVSRMLPMGQQYLSDDRDPNHPSETELAPVKFDYEISAYDGDLDSLRVQANSLLAAVKSLIRSRSNA